MLNLDLNGFGSEKPHTMTRPIADILALTQICKSIKPRIWNNVEGVLEVTPPIKKEEDREVGIRYIAQPLGGLVSVPVLIKPETLDHTGSVTGLIRRFEFLAGMPRPVDAEHVIHRFVDCCHFENFHGFLRLSHRAIPYDNPYTVEFRWDGVKGEMSLTYMQGRGGTRVPFLLPWFAEYPLGTPEKEQGKKKIPFRRFWISLRRLPIFKQNGGKH